MHLQTVWEEMHLRVQEIFYLTLTLEGHIKHFPLHHVTYVIAKFEIAMVKEMHLPENTLFDLDIKVTRNVVQYPLYYVTYSATKFEVATSNGLGGDTFTRNVTDGQTDRLWYEINIPFLLKKKKAGIVISITKRLTSRTMLILISCHLFYPAK